MAGDTTFLRARGLTCRRGGRTVLHGVDLDVPRGCVTALAGPSGAGKTTLLLTLAELVARALVRPGERVVLPEASPAS